MKTEVRSDEPSKAIDPLEKLRRLDLSSQVQERKRKGIMVELVIMAVGGILTFMIAAQVDILETVVEFSHKHERWEIDELLPTALFLLFAFAVFSVRRWFDLRATLLELKYLRGILPVCAGCNSVKDDGGNWCEWERYVHEHTEAVFSHGLCPDCAKRLYGEDCLGE
jgi:hypothetical protein